MINMKCTPQICKKLLNFKIWKKIQLKQEQMIQQIDNQKRYRQQVGTGNYEQYHMPLQVFKLNRGTIVHLLK